MDAQKELQNIVNLDSYPLCSEALINKTREELGRSSVITLPNFLRSSAVDAIVQESLRQQHKAFYTNSTHNVYLTPRSELYPQNHVYNLQIKSTKGCVQADQIKEDSLLKSLYYNAAFQEFLARVLEVDRLCPYQDPLSSVNVHFASRGQNLGWHFDNSAFATTLLLRKPRSGGTFEYVPNVRDSSSRNADEETRMGFERVRSVLDGNETPRRLNMEPGTLVLFRGRNALHRVTPVEGDRTRILAVLAYNETPGVELSEEARITFYGRTGV